MESQDFAAIIERRSREDAVQLVDTLAERGEIRVTLDRMEALRVAARLARTQGLDELAEAAAKLESWANGESPRAA